jgi:hypothetical protein
MLDKENTKYYSLGGWLIPLQVFIILNGISWFRNLELFIGLLNEKDKLMETIHAQDPSIYMSFIYFEIVTAVVMLIFTIAMFYFMFRRYKLFKLLTIIYFITEVILEAAVIFIFSSRMEGIGAVPVEKIYFTAAIALLVIVYIIKSKRVELTFIN